MKVYELLDALRDVDPMGEVDFIVNNPIGCCGDPHEHDIPDLIAGHAEVSDIRPTTGITVRLAELWP